MPSHDGSVINLWLVCGAKKKSNFFLLSLEEEGQERAGISIGQTSPSGVGDASSRGGQGDGSRAGVGGPLMPTFCDSCPACRLRTTVSATACSTVSSKLFGARAP